MNTRQWVKLVLSVGIMSWGVVVHPVSAQQSDASDPSQWQSVVKDYDGDGKLDPAIYNSQLNVTYLLRSSDKALVQIDAQAGAQQLIPIPADYKMDESVVSRAVLDNDCVPLFESLRAKILETKSAANQSSLKPANVNQAQVKTEYVYAYPAPANVKASDGAYTDKIRITWDTVAGAANYEVQRSGAGNSSGSANVIGNTTGTTYNDSSPSPGFNYKYYVIAKGPAGSSDPDAATDIGFAFGPPSYLYAYSRTNDVYLNWSSCLGATGYELWRSSDNVSSSSSRIGTTPNTWFTDTDATYDSLYYYWVKAANQYTSTCFTAYTTGYKKLMPPAGVKASAGTFSDRVRVVWNAVVGATSYDVWRSPTPPTSDNVSFSLLGNKTTTYYDNMSADLDVTYYYKVKANNSLGSSDLSAYDVGYRANQISLSPPTGVSASDGTYLDKVRVTWNAVSGVTGYQIWRNTTNNSLSATMLAATSDTSYDDATATTPGLTLYYWVNARNNDGVTAFSQPDVGYCGTSGSSGIADLSLRGFLFQPAVTTVNAHPDMVMLMPVNNGPDILASSGIGFDFFLSRNAVFGDGDDEWIGDYATTVSINAGAFASVIVSDAGLNGIAIPPTASGAYYVFAKVRHTSSILDPNMINNTIMRSGAIIVGAGDGAKEPVAGDFDGDGIADPAVYQESTGNWYIKLSGGEYGLIQVTGFGGEGWKPISGDYDGDGKSDVAIYQESTGSWRIKLSASNYSEWTAILGGLGYSSVAGDFDGGGHSDLVVYREASGYWLAILMETEAPIYFQFGQDGYVPVTGDYTGDGVTDLALYQESTGSWFLKLGDLVYTLTGFGGDGWKPVGGDYDGDGLEDLMLYQASTGKWMIRLSGSEYAILAIEGFGGADYKQVSGDYDGDGMADLVLYNAATSTWMLRLSSAGYSTIMITF